jgi:hypothetical protein
MATVNYSVPDEIKRSFNKTFAKRNKSAVIAALMQAAVEDEKLHRQRGEAIDRLLSMRHRISPMSAEAFRKVREAGRP